MASLDKFGNLVDDATGKYIGLRRLPGEKDTDYTARGDRFNSGDKTASTNVIERGQTYTQQPIQQQTQVQAPSAPTYQSPQTDYSDYINRLSQAQNDANLAQIQKARDTSVNNYQQEINSAPQRYQPSRNEADVQATNNAQALREIMAERGLFRSGENVTEQGRIQATRDNTVGDLNRQELNYVDALKNSQVQAKNNAEYDTAASLSQTEAQKLQALIDQANRDRDFTYGQYRDSMGDYQTDRNFNYGVNRDAVGDSRYNQEYSDSRNDITYDRNYQQGRDTIGDSRYNQEWDYQKEQTNLDREYQKWLDSQGGSSGSGGSSGTYTQQKNAATGEAYDWANNIMMNGYSQQEALNLMYQNGGKFVAEGVDLRDLENFINTLYGKVGNPAKSAQRFESGGYIPM